MLALTMSVAAGELDGNEIEKQLRLRPAPE
jgi:hypothetical protein